MTSAKNGICSHSVRLGIGVTGHRHANQAYAANAAAIESVLEDLFADVDRLTGEAAVDGLAIASTRLSTLLVDGTDQLAARLGRALGWEIVAPLPFGRTLNAAINAAPETPADVRAILAGQAPADAAVAARLAAIAEAADNARVFELAEQDDRIAQLYLAAVDAPDDPMAARVLQAETAYRASLAGRVLIEHSDLLVAVWDGVSWAELGSAGWTVATALDLGSPVLWIDPARPADWRIMETPEELIHRRKEPVETEGRHARLRTLVKRAVLPEVGEAEAREQIAAARAFEAIGWRPKSNRLAHAYRRVEALFDGGKRPFRSLVQRYEAPDAVASGSGENLDRLMRTLPGSDPHLAESVRDIAMRGFAFADGVSSRLSDAFRGGMTVSFILSAFAIVGGILYLPFGLNEQKWVFALFEFSLLVAIIAITVKGQKGRWHQRWFQTRRVAEYFRHSPLMLVVGSARPPGLWPQATGATWPEWYVRHALRAIGLPRGKVSAAYLREALQGLLREHIVPQRDYHAAKAGRLRRVHHNLDRLSEWMFGAAVLSVTLYLLLAGATELGLFSAPLLEKLGKTFTVLGVAFPTFGAAIAGIRYFGDFERFAAISEATAEKLTFVETRAQRLLDAPPDTIDYGHVAALVHAADEVVFSEIESWQSVFGSKATTIPV